MVDGQTFSVSVLLHNGTAPGVYPNQRPLTCPRCRFYLYQGESMASYQALDPVGGEWKVVCNDCGEEILRYYRDVLKLTAWGQTGNRWDFIVTRRTVAR